MRKVQLRWGQNMARMIGFEKCLNPFQLNQEERLDIEYDDGVSDEAKDQLLHDNDSHLQMIITPMGIVPITENTNPFKIFNLWTVHLNFRLTASVAQTIEDTDGIETLDIFTPYRCRIGIAKAFISSEVKQNMTKRLNAEPLKIIPQED